MVALVLLAGPSTKRFHFASVSFSGLPSRSVHLDARDALARQQLLELRVLLEVVLLVAELHLVERRHGDVDVAAVDQLRHLPVEEREDQRADVRAVDVGVGHHDHAVVAELLEVELLADARADRGDHRLDLVVRENLVDAVLLAVDDLPAQRQDRLVGAVAAHLRRAAGAVALDDEELGALGSLIEQSASLPGSDIDSSADLRRVSSRALRAAWRARDAAIALLMIWRASVGFSSKNSASFWLTAVETRPRDPRVAELRLRLPLELRVLQLHAR